MQEIHVNYLGYTITTDKDQMVIEDIHKWLSEVSYWCAGIPFETFKKSFDNSFCIGTIIDRKQVGFARLITDYATFAYLADVYVKEEHRGNGISKKMMQLLFDLDWIKWMRCIRLATMDAQGLYKQFGFTECLHPERIMEIVRPDIYKTKPE